MIASALLRRATEREATGELARAAADYERARRLLGRRVTAEVLQGLGEVRCKQGRYPEARRALLAALRRADAPGVEASVRASLGILGKATGRFDEAERHYRTALAIVKRQEGLSSEAAAGLFHNLGGLEHARGRYRRAEPLARRAVEIRTRLLGRDHLDTAEDRAAWAAILDRLGRHDEAEQIYRDVLPLFRRAGRSDDVAVTYHNLAWSRAARGHLVRARRYGERALAMKRVLLGARHPDVRATRELLDRIVSLSQERRRYVRGTPRAD